MSILPKLSLPVKFTSKVMFVFKVMRVDLRSLEEIFESRALAALRRSNQAASAPNSGRGQNSLGLGLL
ncbi:MAG: hypothetical protein WBZ33_07480, partial [Thermoactinomyces sp.]